MKIETNEQYQKALKKRSDLLEAYSFLGTVNTDSLDRQISEIDAQIEQYENNIRLTDDEAIEKYRLKEQGDYPCGRCGSYKYTQEISDKIGVICKECLNKTLNDALNDTLKQLGVEHRV